MPSAVDRYRSGNQTDDSRPHTRAVVILSSGAREVVFNLAAGSFRVPVRLSATSRWFATIDLSNSTNPVKLKQPTRAPRPLPGLGGPTPGAPKAGDSPLVLRMELGRYGQPAHNNGPADGRGRPRAGPFVLWRQSCRGRRLTRCAARRPVNPYRIPPLLM